MKKICIILILMFFGINVKAYEVDNELDELINKSNNLINNSFLSNHPIGSIYETTNDDENTIEKMHELYGGTWEVYGNNKVLRSSTDDIGGTGGNDSINITASQIPSLNVIGTKAVQNITSRSTGSGYSVGHTAANRTTSSNGSHTHAFTAGGYAISIGATSMAYGIPNDYGFQPKQNSWWWSGHNKNTSAIAANGNHNHSASDYYVVNAKISGVQSHAHNITVPAKSITSSYTNSNQNKINVLDPYITVYRYKRIS